MTDFFHIWKFLFACLNSFYFQVKTYQTLCKRIFKNESLACTHTHSELHTQASVNDERLETRGLGLSLLLPSELSIRSNLIRL